MGVTCAARPHKVQNFHGRCNVVAVILGVMSDIVALLVSLSELDEGERCPFGKPGK